MKILPSIAVLFLFFALLTVSICVPEFLADNKFMNNFVNHEFINFMAVVVTVTCVSIVSLHMEYTRIERREGVRVFQGARRAINLSAIILISVLIVAFVVSFLVPIFDGNLVAISILYAFSITGIFQSILIMYEIVITACFIAENEPIGEENDQP